MASAKQVIVIIGEKRGKTLPIIAAEPKSEYDISTKLTPVPVINEVPAYI